MLKWTIFRYTPSKFLRSFLHFSYIFQQFKKKMEFCTLLHEMIFCLQLKK